MLIVALYGAFYAATDGVLVALVLPFVPDDRKTTGLALLQTGQAVAYLLSSVLFGLLWTYVSVQVACLAAAGAAAVLLPCCALLLRPVREGAMRARIVIAVLASVLLVATAVVWAATRPETTVRSTLGVPAHTGVLVRDTSTGHLAWSGPMETAGRARPSARARTRPAAGRSAFPRPGRRVPLVSAGRVPESDQGVPDRRRPTRARVSADGRMVAWTVFVSGDSYLSSGFSTRTGVLDLQSGRVITTLEDFTIDGKKLPIDANFWGISFAGDDNTFYSTMATGDHLYLVRGDFAAGTLLIMDDGVECPSLSPDDRRLVYKKRLPDLTWQLWVYDLGIRRADPARRARQRGRPGRLAGRGDRGLRQDRENSGRGQRLVGARGRHRRSETDRRECRVPRRSLI